MWKPEDNEMFKMYGKICQYKILFPMKIKYEGDIQTFFRRKKTKKSQEYLSTVKLHNKKYSTKFFRLKEMILDVYKICT